MCHFAMIQTRLAQRPKKTIENMSQMFFAGAAMQKSFAIQEWGWRVGQTDGQMGGQMDGPTNQQTQQVVELHVRDLKRTIVELH